MKIMELISRINLFQELAPEDLRHLADHTERRSYGQDEIIFNAGDAGNDLHMIEKGRVEIFIPPNARRARNSAWPYSPLGSSSGNCPCSTGSPVPPPPARSSLLRFSSSSRNRCSPLSRNIPRPRSRSWR